ncbi:hypothetical protein [Stenotrophomonas sp.]|uniref:hypothetical protein n=1 Tax=Stenotrophomonas sp. TaxID=69392 RepID=UPI0028A0988D|nr:hypothetical protein [Stenotrophomonas sp.]
MDVNFYPSHAKSFRRAGLARAALYASVVDGKLYTTAQIAKELGIANSTAWERTKRGPFPLTWEALRKPGKRRK